jgi:hypothetical protein|tara:strand:- start:476 stop:592 length:117 start_codon:yes stop_codon:yes gene_type:complete
MYRTPETTAEVKPKRNPPSEVLSNVKRVEAKHGVSEEC